MGFFTSFTVTFCIVGDLVLQYLLIIFIESNLVLQSLFNFTIFLWLGVGLLGGEGGPGLDHGAQAAHTHSEPQALAQGAEKTWQLIARGGRTHGGDGVAEVVAHCGSQTLAQGQTARRLVAGVAVASIGEHGESLMKICQDITLSTR